MIVQALLAPIQGTAAARAVRHTPRLGAPQHRDTHLSRVEIGFSATENSCFQRHHQVRLRATGGAIPGVEPDLPETFEYVPDSEWQTAFEDREDEFPYGKADGHHTWHKGDDNVEFLDGISQQIKDAGGPNDHLGQAIISWLFIPGMICGFAFQVQPDYLFLAAILFIFAFIGIEMAKPEKPGDVESEFK